MTHKIRYACVEDVDNVCHFINKASITTDGVAEIIDYFVLLEDENNEIKITIGVEPIAEFGLLRSLVLSPGITEKELLCTFDKLLQLARERELKELYLATNKDGACSFLKILGFQQTNKENLPEQLFTSHHMTHVLDQEDVQLMKRAIREKVE